MPCIRRTVERPWYLARRCRARQEAMVNPGPRASSLVNYAYNSVGRLHYSWARRVLATLRSTRLGGIAVAAEIADAANRAQFPNTCRGTGETGKQIMRAMKYRIDRRRALRLLGGT